MILDSENLYKMDQTSMAGLLSGLVNSMFNHFMVSSKKFIISDECIYCKKCDLYRWETSVWKELYQLLCMYPSLPKGSD